MSFDFDTLITDRTNADVSDLSALMAKKLETWTPEELEQFNNGLLKGGYWWTDLNRVTACMEYLDEELRSLGYESGYVPVVVHDNGMGFVDLPDGYVQLEYIESTGTQCIDTGIMPNQDTCFELSARVSLGNAGDVHIMSSNVPKYFALRPSSDYSSFAVRYGNDTALKNIQTDDVYSYHKFKRIKNDFYLDDNLGASSDYVTFQNTKTLTLGCLNSAQGYNQFCRAKYKYLKIWEYGKGLARFLVPCVNPSGKVGMYDTVEGKFYSNAGTGDFTAGPVFGFKVPYGYTQLEYIESTGSQYIDTGIKPGGNTRVHCAANFQTQEAGAWLFGARDSTSTNAYGFLTYKNGYRSDYNSAGSQIPDSYGPELEIDKDGPSTYLNGSLVDSSKLSSFSAKDDLVIGANATSGAVSGFSRAIHRWYKIYDNSVLTRDFVPCKNASGDVGMFDTVTSMFYGNVGNGSFIAGPEYSPGENPDVVDPYTWYKEDSPKIEQLQQYIDNVAAIRSAFDGLKNAPEAPTTPRKITVEIANNIEKILLAVETAIQQTVKCMVRSNSFAFWSGNRAFPTAESNRGRTWAELDAMNTGWRNWQLATWYLLLYGNLKAEGDVM